MEVSLTWRLRACEALTANSTTCWLRTGSAPGIPRQTGQTLVLGSEPKTLGQAQKILVLVRSWTCTSRPITVSYLDRTSTDFFAVIAIWNPIINGCRCKVSKFQRFQGFKVKG